MPRPLLESEAMAERGEVTLLLERWLSGDEDAGEELLGRVYDDLRSLAARYLRKERIDHTLSPTSLVNEAYLRLVRNDLHAGRIVERSHFFAVAAQAMRRILVEHARRYSAGRRASPKQRVELDETGKWNQTDPKIAEVLAIDEAVERLRKAHPRPAQVVEMRYFGGLTEEEIAVVLDISRATVARDWRVARMMLSRILKQGIPGE